eukprot:768424-Hanusia_phi.AAC.5
MLSTTLAALGIKGSIKKAEDIASSYGDDAWMPQQFSNPDNVKIHMETTGPEVSSPLSCGNIMNGLSGQIWEQTDGKIDAVIAGVGTGGTLTGISRFLKSKNKDIKTIAVEPAESPVMSGGKPGPHKIQGIGAGFIPINCDMDLVDEVVPVPSSDAMTMARRLATEPNDSFQLLTSLPRDLTSLPCEETLTSLPSEETLSCTAVEGVFVGISSGAVVHAACEIGKRPDMKGKRIVVIVASFGERYLSTALFSDLLEEAKEQVVEEVKL